MRSSKGNFLLTFCPSVATLRSIFIVAMALNFNGSLAAQEATSSQPIPVLAPFATARGPAQSLFEVDHEYRQALSKLKTLLGER